MYETLLDAIAVACGLILVASGVAYTFFVNGEPFLYGATQVWVGVLLLGRARR